MSLQLWLPLDGDLRNNGLSDVTVTNNDAVVNTAGKIGSCYKIGTAASDISIDKSLMTSFEGACSVCFWLKINTWNSNYCTFFEAGFGEFYYQYVFGFLRNNNASTCVFAISDGTNASGHYSGASYVTSTMSLDIWYHVCLVYEPGKCQIYLNGVLDKEYTTSIIPDYSKITYIRIGRQAGSRYQTDCYMNDLRIYDHALSLKEIQEISKGLILHYPLDCIGPGYGSPNLISKSAYTEAPWATAITGTETYQDKSATLVGCNTLYQNTSRGENTLFPNITFKENTQYTMSVDWADHIRTDGKNTRMNLRFDYTDGSTRTTMRSPDNTVTTDWVHNSITSTAGKTVAKITTTYANAGTVSVANLKIEEGTVETAWSPSIEDGASIIYDTSGYQHDGEIVGSLDIVSNSARYAASSYFDGASAIKNNTLRINDMSWTASAWFRYDVLPTTYQSIFCFSRNAGAAADKKFAIIPKSSSAIWYKADAYSVTKTVNLSTDTWYLFTLVNDNGAVSFYQNGAPIYTSTASSELTGAVDFVVGACANSAGAATLAVWDKGYISDVRVYATALSSQDVLALYNNRLSADRNGTYFAQGKFVEDTKVSTTRTGITTSNSFGELGLPVRYVKDYTSGNTVNTNAHWNEIQVFDASNTNIALGKVVNVNGTDVSNSKVTDGVIDANYNGGGGTHTCILDLGSIYNVYKIMIWHYYSDGRTYHDNKTEVSVDGTNWITVYDTAVTGEKPETIQGNTILLTHNTIQHSRNMNTYVNQLMEV